MIKRMIGGGLLTLGLYLAIRGDGTSFWIGLLLVGFSYGCAWRDR